MRFVLSLAAMPDQSAVWMPLIGSSRCLSPPGRKPGSEQTKEVVAGAALDAYIDGEPRMGMARTDIKLRMIAGGEDTIAFRCSGINVGSPRHVPKANQNCQKLAELAFEQMHVVDLTNSTRPETTRSL